MSLAKALVVGGGMVIGVVAEVFEFQNGVQAIDVLLGLQVLVLGAVWQVGREISRYRGSLDVVQGELAKKATLEDVRTEILSHMPR